MSARAGRGRIRPPKKRASPPCRLVSLALCFFFNDTATTEIYTLSLHDALPIFAGTSSRCVQGAPAQRAEVARRRDRKSTRLNSSHGSISYAVFCLKTQKSRLPSTLPKAQPRHPPPPRTNTETG